jgi:PAS domain S-box-containing protein
MPTGPDAPSAGLPPAPQVLAALVAACRDALALVDREGRIGWVNDAFERVSAAPRALALRSRIDELLFGADTEAATRLWLMRRLREGLGFETVELKCRRADGQACWLAISGTPIPDAGDEAAVALVLTDVTDAHREARERQRLAELLDMAQEFGRIGVWERDIRTMEGRWDRHVFRFWGLEPTDGTPPFAKAASFVHPDDDAVSVVRDSLRKAGTYSTRYRVLRPDGSRRLLHSQWIVKNGPAGVPERAIGIMMDDTEVYELAQSYSDANEQLEMAVELARLAVWRHDLKSGRMFLDDRAWQVLGFPAQPEGMPIDDLRALIHPDDIVALDASGRHALTTNEPADVELRYQRPDGEWRYLLTRRVVQRDAQGKPFAFLGVALDVTERVEGSRDAVALARRLESATQAARVGLWSTKVETGELQWNDQMLQLFGVLPGQQPKTFVEWLERCVHPDDAARVKTIALEWLRHGQSLLELEYRTRRDDGTIRWLINRSDLDRSRPATHVYGITIDVTEQHAAMEALRDASARAALAARSVGMGTWELDLRTGLTYWDDQMYVLRDMEPQPEPPPAEFRNELVHPDDRETTMQRFDEATQKARPAYYEFRVRQRDGSYRWLASRSNVLFDESGRAIRRIGVNWDISDSKTAEIARQEKAVALRENQAKSEFLARMSHELRTPLNAVLGFTQLLLAQTEHEGEPVDREVLRQRLEHIRGAGQHLLSLINDVLDLSSLDSRELRVQRVPVSLPELVAQTLPLVERMAQQYGVRLRVGSLHGTALADATRLRQVLLNLLSNAIKYNQPHGTVTIATACEDGEHGAQVWLTVSDTGRGMSEQQLKHVFEPFNRLGIEREGIEGTGIGLTIVKALVERMGGEVHVRSQAGAGTVFDVVLPRATEDAASDTQRPLPPRPPMPTEDPPEPPRAARHGRLLYIEDNPVNVLIISELVAQRGGLQLDVATDGETGVARALQGQPDVVLVDMQLPGIDGHEVRRRLRSDPRTAHIPCIALSANAMPQDVEQALKAGFVDYWTKPVDFKAFASALDALFD